MREMRRLAESWKWDELLERPMKTGSPLIGISIEGTAPRGTRSDALENDLLNVGRAVASRGGDEGAKSVCEVGTGVM